MGRSDSHFPATRASVVNELGKGTNQAWQTFFEIYGPIIHRFARHAGLSAHDADEVLANVMRSFLQRTRRGDFRVDHKKGRFRHYLRKVTNRVIARQREENAKRRAPLDGTRLVEDCGPAPDEGWAVMERRERLRTCLERLRCSATVRPRDLYAFDLYALQGYSAESVAALLEISKSRLYAIKHEIIGHLRRIHSQLDGVLGEV